MSRPITYLVTTNQYSIQNQCSSGHSGSTLFFSKEAFFSIFDALLHACYSQRVLWAHCVYTMNSPWIHHEFMMHIRPCSLYTGHSFTFSSMRWEDEVGLLQPNLQLLIGWRSCDMNKLSPVIQSISPVKQSSPQSSPTIRYDLQPVINFSFKEMV